MAKLCPRKFSSETLNENSTDTESRNSNSSICSHSSNDTNEEEEEYADEEIDDQSDQSVNTNSTIKKLTNAIVSSPLDICVDCYHLMESLQIKVSSNQALQKSSNVNKQQINLNNKNENNINSVYNNSNINTNITSNNNNNNIVISRKKSNNLDLMKILHKNIINTTSPLTKTNLKLSPDSPIAMSGLDENINVINNSSPFTNNKISMSHHSTPTPSISMPIGSPTDYKQLNSSFDYENNMEQLNLNSKSNFELDNQLANVQNLTLDFQPISAGNTL